MNKARMLKRSIVNEWVSQLDKERLENDNIAEIVPNSDFATKLSNLLNDVKEAIEYRYKSWKYNEDTERVTELCYRVTQTDADWEDNDVPFDEDFIKQAGLEMLGKSTALVLEKENLEGMSIFSPLLFTECELSLLILGCYVNMLNLEIGYMPWNEWRARCRTYLYNIDYPKELTVRWLLMQLGVKYAFYNFNRWAKILPGKW